jgi:GT2 family glycosyltransferase
MARGHVYGSPKAAGPPMKDLLASVVIPVGADSRHIANCARRVLAQDYAKKEIIVVCDARTRDLDELPPGSEEFRIIRERRRAHLPELINAGMRAARGHIKVLLMPHCEPKGEDWLGQMVAPFDDERTGVVVAQCVPAEAGGLDLPARLAEAVDPWERRAQQKGNEPVESVSHQCDAYRASLLADIGYFNADDLSSPGEAVDISLRIADAGYGIVLTSQATVAHHTPSDSTGIGAVLRRALDYGRADAMLDRLYELRWLNAGVLAAAAVSLLLLPVAVVSRPAAVAVALLLLVWGGFLSVRVPILKWDCPTAAINFAAYVVLILIVRKDWRPDWFGKQIHPAVLRQWCLLAAVCGSYMLLVVRSAATTAWQAGRAGPGRAWVPAVFLLAVPWWLAAGLGYVHGRLLPRKLGE